MFWWLGQLHGGIFFIAISRTQLTDLLKYHRSIWNLLLLKHKFRSYQSVVVSQILTDSHHSAGAVNDAGDMISSNPTEGPKLLVCLPGLLRVVPLVPELGLPQRDTSPLQKLLTEPPIPFIIQASLCAEPVTCQRPTNVNECFILMCCPCVLVVLVGGIHI